MKKTLNHHSEHKQRQLHRAVEIILEMTKPDLLILFGSYARGDWVDHMEDDGVHFGDVTRQALQELPFTNKPRPSCNA
jgi:uncharacterized protein